MGLEMACSPQGPSILHLEWRPPGTVWARNRSSSVHTSPSSVGTRHNKPWPQPASARVATSYIPTIPRLTEMETEAPARGGMDFLRRTQRETGLPRPVSCRPPAGTSQGDPKHSAQTREARPLLHQLPSPGLDFPTGSMADSDTVSRSERRRWGGSPQHASMRPSRPAPQLPREGGGGFRPLCLPLSPSHRAPPGLHPIAAQGTIE